MKKIIYSTICSVIFIFTSATFAQQSANSILQTQFNDAMSTAENELVIALQYLSEQLDKKSDHLLSYDKHYCNITYENCIGSDGTVYDAATHNDMGDILSREYADVVIDRISAGWVGFPTGSSQAAVDDPLFDFIDISVAGSSHDTVFSRHLCAEVHFKDSSQIHNAMTLYGGKSVVICALAPGGELIDIDMVDSETDNGGDTSHKILPVDKGSWTCFNPHNDLCNDGATNCSGDDPQGNTPDGFGAGFGFNTDGINPNSPYTLANMVFGMCINQASSVLE